MTEAARQTLPGTDFFDRARAVLTLDPPRGLTDPDTTPLRGDHDADPVLKAIAAVRPIKPAAVLIPVVDRDEPMVLLTQRTAHLPQHPGQIAFPGGTLEPDETDPVAAALREAREEAGVEPAAVEVLGALPKAHISRSGFDVTSVVGWWREPGPLQPGDPFEIQAVHQIEVPTLLDPGNRVTWVMPNGYSGPAFVVGELFIWGFTAYLLDGLFDLLGWTVDWDASRTSEIPRRFFSERL